MKPRKETDWTDVAAIFVHGIWGEVIVILLTAVRSHYMMVLSRKNMAPSFKDTLPSGIYIPGVSPGGGGGLHNSVIFKRRLACISVHTLDLFLTVLYL